MLKLLQHLVVENTESHSTRINGCLVPRIRKLLRISRGFRFRLSRTNHNEVPPNLVFHILANLVEAFGSSTMRSTNCILQCPDTAAHSKNTINTFVVALSRSPIKRMELLFNTLNAEFPEIISSGACMPYSLLYIFSRGR